ncbi:RNA and export factor-binding protein 2, partial [Stegodyphus mimosarum]
MAEKMDVDMSLDELIRSNRGKFNAFQNRGGRQQRRRGARGAVRGFGRARGNMRQAGFRGKFVSPRGTFKPRAKPAFLTTNRIRRGGASSAPGPAKLLISNLDYGVSDSDIKELFGDFGALRKAVVHYDQSGRSLGTADVVFERRMDAIRALKQYDGVPLDGRPMKIQITSSLTPRINNSFASNLNRRGNARFSGRGRGATRGRGRRGFQRT